MPIREPNEEAPGYCDRRYLKLCDDVLLWLNFFSNAANEWLTFTSSVSQ